MEEFVTRRTVQGGKVGGGFRLLDTSMQKKCNQGSNPTSSYFVTKFSHSDVSV